MAAPAAVRRRDRAGARALLQFSWVDRTLVPRLVPLLAIDVQGIVDEADARHLRGVMEKAFGKTLEELAANRDKDVVGFRRLLDPARASLRVAAVHLRRCKPPTPTTSCSACSSGRAS